MGLMDKQSYQDQRRLLYEYHLNQSGFFDKGILTISSSAVALLSTFMIGKDAKDFVCVSALATASVLFACTILVTLASFRFSVSAAEKQVEKLDQQFENESIPETDESKTWSETITRISNWISMITFTIAIVSMIVFVLSNAP